MELNKGLITTLFSDAGLVFLSYTYGQTLPGTYTPLIIVAIALILAALDIKYPRYMAQFRQALAALNEADTLSQQQEQEPQ